MKLLLVMVAMVAAVAHAATVAQTWYTSSDGKTLMKREMDMVFDSQSQPYDHQINLNDNRLTQPFYGFGAAMTDSSAYLFNRMKEKNPTRVFQVLGNLFNSSGAGLNVLRITISSSDFDLKPSWTLDDIAGDTSLSHFTMAPLEQHILPAVRDVLKVNPDVKIMLSPWSAPAWMKDSNDIGYGRLRNEYLDLYARFWIKVLDGFKATNINVHYLTLQNEPHFEPHGYAGMRMDASQQADLIRRLGAMMGSHNTTKILTWDHNWDEGVAYIDTVYSNADSYKYTGGSAWHCYGGNVIEQQKIASKYPNKEIHLTECSGGDWSGSWHDNFIWNFQNLYMGSIWWGSSSVQQWNLALDDNKGPTTSPGGCKTCRGVITIHGDYSSITENIEYWGMGQFGRFLSTAARGRVSRHAETSASGAASGMSSVGFLIPKSSSTGGDNAVLLVVLNAGNANVRVRVVNDDTEYGTFTAQPGATSLIWRARNQQFQGIDH